jgi:hypothetical protein
VEEDSRPALAAQLAALGLHFVAAAAGSAHVLVVARQSSALGVSSWAAAEHWTQ